MRKRESGIRNKESGWGERENGKRRKEKGETVKRWMVGKGGRRTPEIGDGKPDEKKEKGGWL